MSKPETSLDYFSSDTTLKTDGEPVDDDNNSDESKEKELKEDTLISLETLRESPIQWPERFPGMDDFLITSDTPIHTSNVGGSSTHTLTAEDMEKINKLSVMRPEELITKIKAMHDEIYQLGLRESKEMTRGKLLGIFDRTGVRKQ